MTLGGKRHNKTHLHGPDLALSQRGGDLEHLLLDGDVEHIVAVDCEGGLEVLAGGRHGARDGEGW